MEALKQHQTIYQQLNQQIGREYESMIKYHQIANQLNELDFVNVAKWFNKKGDEELTHARKITEYLYDRNAPVTIDFTIPQVTIKTIKDAFEEALKHEQTVTKYLSELQTNAEKDDRLTYNFLSWFLIEQIEEEAVLLDYLSKIALDAPMYLLDLEFSKC